jgi:glutathione S-transferase
MTLELYHADMSTCAQKVRFVLAEKGLDWEGHVLDLRRRDQHDPAYLKLNPNGVVPTLVHDGHPVIESTVICEYLDEAFPEVPVRPSDPRERALMRIWTKRLDEKLHYYTGVLSGSIAFRHQHLARPADELKAYIEGIPDPARRERQRQQIELGIEAAQFAEALPVFDRFLTDMEDQLSKTPWLAGGSYSLADVAYTPYVIRVDELRLNGWLDSRPRLCDWYERIKARPNFGPGYIEWRNDAYVALMNKTGAEAWPRIQEMMAAG